MSRYQKGKTKLDFTEARDSEWQWHQLGCMHVWTSLQTDNHASTPPLSFCKPDALPATRPTASKHWRQHILLQSGIFLLFDFSLYELHFWVYLFLSEISPRCCAHAHIVYILSTQPSILHGTYSPTNLFWLLTWWRKDINICIEHWAVVTVFSAFDIISRTIFCICSLHQYWVWSVSYWQLS